MNRGKNINSSLLFSWYEGQTHKLPTKCIFFPSKIQILLFIVDERVKKIYLTERVSASFCTFASSWQEECIWKPEKGKPLPILPRGGNLIKCLAFGPHALIALLNSIHPPSPNVACSFLAVSHLVQMMMVCNSISIVIHLGVLLAKPVPLNQSQVSPSLFRIGDQAC